LEAVGVTVVRANYQGDVGMHIAKCLYGILYNPEFAIENAGTGVKERVSFLGKAYATGSTAYEEDAVVKKKIGEINKKIYAKDSSILALYQITRQWSLDYFETIYKRVGSHFDRYYFESEVYISGKDIVQKGLDRRIFEKSDNAIIFRGSQYGLHDRVFITGEGNPTYEGKEMGLGPLQFRENNPDLIMHVVGPEQAGYFQVVFEALAQLDPKTRGKEYHLVYGWVKLKHGKMSSRTGKVILGEWLIDEAKKKIIEKYAVSPEIAEQIAVSAVKYSFLKVGLGQEIAFDLDESISFEGNSGPYLQYTYVRTQSVLRKVKSPQPPLSRGGSVCGVEEREVLRLLVRFPEVVEEAAMRYAPNIVCTYLFELAQAFNVFYQKNQILKAEDEGVRAFRLELTKATGKVLKDGLRLLGIQAPKRM
jgi:arginyl-tRNA synthetase